MPQEEWPTFQAQRDIINSDFDKTTPYGDRRQVYAVPAMTSFRKWHKLSCCAIMQHELTVERSGLDCCVLSILIRCVLWIPAAFEQSGCRAAMENRGVHL